MSFYSHLKSTANIYTQDQVMEWLREDHSVQIKSYLKVQFPQINFVIRYDYRLEGNVFEPKVVIEI